MFESIIRNKNFSVPCYTPLFDLCIRTHPEYAYRSESSHFQPSIADFPEEVIAYHPFSTIRSLQKVYSPIY